MKKIFFVLIAISTLFISCSNASEATSSNNSSSNSSAGAVSSFTGGWYKLTQGNQVTYLYYAANKTVTRAGNSTSEYTSGNQLNTFKSATFNFDNASANYNLTRVTSNFPSWCGVNENTGGNSGSGNSGGGSGTSSNTIEAGWYKISAKAGGNVLYYIYYNSDKTIDKAKGSQGENLFWEALNNVKNNPNNAYDTVKADTSRTITRINESEIPVFVFPQS